ncbi:MAG: hypothetical protein WEA10_04000 [Actinomycetota bacterium]
MLAVSAALVAMLPAGLDAAAGTLPCPNLGGPVLLGPLAQKENRLPHAARHISGMAVSKDNSDATTGQQIVWVVGDRKANEAVQPENDRVYVFGYDDADGSLAIRFRLRPGVFPDDPANTGPPEPDGITSVADSPNPVPDIEDLSIEYRADARDQLWLFDTGDNTTSRSQLNAYRLPEPDLTSTGLGLIGPAGTDLELEGKVEGMAIKPVRFPIKLWSNAQKSQKVHPNIETAFIDVGAPSVTKPIYLIPRAPVDADGDGIKGELRLYRFDTREKFTPNHATRSGWIESGGANYEALGASILPGGSAYAIRTGKANADRVLTFTREADRHISAYIGDGNRAPACSWSTFDTEPSGNREETIAFDLTPAGETGWEGLLWSHDGTDFPPLYGADVEVEPPPGG